MKRKFKPVRVETKNHKGTIYTRKTFYDAASNAGYHISSRPAAEGDEKIVYDFEGFPSGSVGWDDKANKFKELMDSSPVFPITKDTEAECHEFADSIYKGE